MNRKGFTLVELLAVIVILSSISLVAISSITSSLERRDTKECEEQIQLAKNATKIYISLNGGVTEVKISTLKSEGYFSRTSKTDKLNDNDTVKFTGNGYKFNGTGSCKE